MARSAVSFCNEVGCKKQVVLIIGIILALNILYFYVLSQFASTAKYMKNTPYVNEVSNDEALLKRYRREIVDLKKQLEEVRVILYFGKGLSQYRIMAYTFI